MHKGRKGVSPLIAAVLLIAFTMAVAAILTAWVTTFTQEQTETLGNQSTKQIDCSFGQIEIFDSTAVINQTNLTVENSGQIDFENISATALQGGSVLKTAYINGLDAGQIKSVEINHAEKDEPTADQARIAAEKCPTVTDSTTF